MKRLLLRALAFVAALTVGAQLHAEPPANDNIAAAQELAGDSGKVTADTTEATREEAEDYMSYSSSASTVWYKWTAQKDGVVSFDTQGSDFDTILAACVNSTVVADNDDAFETNYTSRIEFFAQAGQTYLIRAGGYDDDYGNLVLSWSSREIAIQELTDDFGVVITNSPGVATKESEEISVWYKWTAKNTAPAYFDTFLSDFDTRRLVAYTNSIVVANDYRDGDIAFCAQAGQTYYIRVDFWNDEYGRAVLRWQRNLAEGEWKILAADGIVLDAIGDLPEDLTVADFPAGVTEIADRAFANNVTGTNSLRFVTIPATVTKIGDSAFAGLSNLAWVDYEGDVAAIDVSGSAFRRTPYSLELPFALILDDGVATNVTWILVSGGSSSVPVTNLVPYCHLQGFVGICPEELVIPDGVTHVVSGAFSGWGNEDLAKVTFPSTLQSIDAYAFNGCEALEEVVGIPAGATLSDYAFVGSLYETVRPFELVTYEDIEPVEESWVELYDDEGYYYNGYYACYTTNVWVRGFHGVCPEEMTIPEGIYGIAYSVFSFDVDNYNYNYNYGNFRCLDNLRKVILPASLREIDNYAFSYLRNLEEVAFLGKKEDVAIGYYAFAGTPYMQKQPFELTTSWSYSFKYDENGYVVYDDYGYPVIASSNRWVTGYSGYKVPETIVIPDDVYGIYGSAFAGLEGVTGVTISASVKYIGRNAFADCADLATVTFLGKREEIGDVDYAFLGTPYSATLDFKVLYDFSSVGGGYYSAYKYVYDEEWGYGSYQGTNWVEAAWHTNCNVYGYVGTCPAKLDLTQHLTNKWGYTSYDRVTFGTKAFADTEELTELVLPAAAYSSYEYTYSDGGVGAYDPDTDLYLANIYQSRYDGLAVKAFHNCTNLATVTVSGDGTQDKLWRTRNFQGTPWLDTVVPFELLTGVYVVTNYDNPVLVKETGDGCCTPREQEWFVQTNVVTRTIVTNFYGNVPATLTFPENIDEIDGYVFADCDNITDVVVPGNVKSVGYGAFQHCDNLEDVNFEEGVESIGGSLFYGCGDGMQVTLPASAVVGYYDAAADTWRGGSFDYSSVFYGIDGDVNVLAPRTTSIYDRAFYNGSYYSGNDIYRGGFFGRTCVEYFTHVVLDANGGTFEGPAAYRCFGDVVSDLPTPVLAGNVFREWWDKSGDYYRNGDEWDENDAQVYLTAEWAVEQKYTVYGLNGPVEITLGEGDTYETLLRVLEDAYGANPQASRHGLTFRYWTVDGVELNHRSVIGANSMFGAYFDEFNPLTDNPDKAVDNKAAQTYDGYVLDVKGNCAGTIQVKVGKPNQKSGEAKISATVQLFGAAKMSFKADSKGGSWPLAASGATKGVTLASAKASDKIVIDVSEKGIFGKYGTYDVIGSRNTSKTDKAYDSWNGKTYEVAFETKAGTGSALAGGYSGVTVAIGKKGKVKISGVMADGTKINANTQLLISDKGEACINVFAPMYAGKKGGFGFVLWVEKNFTTTYVESVSTWTCADQKAPFTAELEALGAAAPAPAGTMAFSLGAVPTISGATVLTNYLPVAVQATFSGGKITVAKGNTIKLNSKTKAIERKGATDNDAGLKLNYAAKTGSFKGSFTVYTLVNSKLKKVKADVNGVFVGGVGYGSAVIKKVGSYPVTLGDARSVSVATPAL